jgi:hypothetical protein
MDSIKNKTSSAASILVSCFPFSIFDSCLPMFGTASSSETPNYFKFSVF